MVDVASYSQLSSFSVVAPRLTRVGPDAVSQFTLLAKTTKGSKPDFHGAMGGEEASRLYHYFVQRVQAGYASDRVKDGKFQAMMQVALVNDGPVCIPTIFST